MVVIQKPSYAVDKETDISFYSLEYSVRFLEEEGVHNIEQLTAGIMEEYQYDLAFRLTAKGKPT